MPNTIQQQIDEKRQHVVEPFWQPQYEQAVPIAQKGGNF
jgi:hypothetical protein